MGPVISVFALRVRCPINNRSFKNSDLVSGDGIWLYYFDLVRPRFPCWRVSRHLVAFFQSLSRIFAETNVVAFLKYGCISDSYVIYHSFDVLQKLLLPSCACYINSVQKRYFCFFFWLVNVFDATKRAINVPFLLLSAGFLLQKD